MHPALLYLPGGRLSLPELGAARLDGHVFELGDGYIPADVVETPAARAATLIGLLSAGLAASGPTAAWIHGAGDAPPSRHHAHRAVPTRVRSPATTRLTFHDTVVEPESLEQIGGMPVTTSLRTMTDLALGLHRRPDFGVWLHALAALRPSLAPATRDALASRRRVPGMRLALDELDRLAELMLLAEHQAQDEVTRYTS